MSSNKTIATLTVAALCAVGAIHVVADEDIPELVKKTLDGRCLADDHPDYWDTKIYIAKPSMDACVASGGKPA